MTSFVAVDAEIFEFSLSDLCFFSRYRRHPGFSSEEVNRIAMSEFYRSVKDAVAGFYVRSSEKVLAASVLTESEAETDFFGVGMGRLSCWVSGQTDSSLIYELVDRTLDAARRLSPIRHVSAEVDIDNYVVLNCLIRAGFEILDIRRTYFTNTLRESRTYEKFLGNVRRYEPSDTDSVISILDQAKFETRFTRDRFLSGDLAEQFYRRWFLRLLSMMGHQSQAVVYVRNGKVVGCGGIGEKSFSDCGVMRSIRTGSLYACLPEGIGGYGAVLYWLTRDALTSHDVVETTVSLNNASAIRVVEGVRPNRSITTYAMRKVIS